MASVNPYETDMFSETTATEVASGTYHVASFSNVTAFETDEGLVLVDTGLPMMAEGGAATLREETQAPVAIALYTHGHMDHAFALEHYLREGQDDPTVIAHERMPDRFDRYRDTAGHNAAVNARQFMGTAPDPDGPDEGDLDRFGWPDHPPTRLYRDELTITLGDCTLEIHHGKGETDDHSWAYCPERDVLCPGDFVIGVAPNAGNPQKVQRYPWEWAETLREMAGLEAATMCPGHGDPIVDDEDAVRERLIGGAEYLETIVDRTLAALNDGSPPHVDIVTEIDLPDPEEPWLAEVYDDGEFVARSVLRYFGGWWTGRPSELKPAPRTDLASAIADLAGDAETLADRAQTLAEDGEYRLATHLADFALEATPDSETVREQVAAIHEERAGEETDLMSRNIYAAAAEYARQGRPYR